MTLSEEIKETKNLLKGTVKELNGSMKRHNQNWRMVLYHILLVLSIIGFLILIAAIIRLQLPQPTEPRCCWKCLSYHNTIPTETIFWWTMVMKMFVAVVSSLMFIWWMKYLSKLISGCREAMKPWQKTISDTYAFMIEMEKMLHKASCEKLKKNIEKSEADQLPREDVDKLVEQRNEEILNQVLKDKTIVDQWVVRLKDTEPK